MNLVGLRQLPAVVRNMLLVVAFGLGVAMLLLLLPERALGQDYAKPTLVVATAKADGDPNWRRTVMVAVPLGDGSHIGLLLNRPTRWKMADAFPDFEPARNITDYIYQGGPNRQTLLTALTIAAEQPDGSMAFGPGAWLIIQASAIDALIEKTPNAARYFQGHVYWKPGELEQEVKGGIMALLPFDASKLLAKDPSKLYDELAPIIQKPALRV